MLLTEYNKGYKKDQEAGRLVCLVNQGISSHRVGPISCLIDINSTSLNWAQRTQSSRGSRTSHTLLVITLIIATQDIG